VGAGVKIEGARNSFFFAQTQQKRRKGKGRGKEERRTRKKSKCVEVKSSTLL